MADAAEGPREADPALPAQGAREALPAHGRREGAARRDPGRSQASAQGAAAPASSSATACTPAHGRTGAGAGCRVIPGRTAASLSRRHPRRRSYPSPPPPGREGWPTFSPDGNQIAFQWDGEVTEGASPLSRDWDIWLKMIGSSETRRLTTDPALDCCPSWSPDGRADRVHPALDPRRALQRRTFGENPRRLAPGRRREARSAISRL